MLSPPFPPIVFVHGNGDTAALWHTTVWRFESNGWPRERLFAVDLPYPLARVDDSVPQAGRSSSEDHRLAVAQKVDEALAATGAQQVVLIANSRGGFAVRNYIAQGGAPKVSHAIMGGTPNHGTWANEDFYPGSEFNGEGPFLQRLNSMQHDGSEVPAAVAWLTLRSDGNDKYAQADGKWLGAPGMPTGVDSRGPALRGAINIELAGVDHRETSFSPQAFAAMWHFLTGQEPQATDPIPEDPVQLSGKVSGLGVDNTAGQEPNNLPLAGAQVAVYRCDAGSGVRVGQPLWQGTVGVDGLWGPLHTDAHSALEFVLSAPGYATTHIYRSPFVRSSNLVHLRAERVPTDHPIEGCEITLTRPRGYFDRQRDQIMLGQVSPPPDVPEGIAGVSTARVQVPSAGRTVLSCFNGERIAAQSWRADQGHVVLIELHS
jgi:triacylglycerol lipase